VTFYFVTGHQRAGTHTFAEKLAQNLDLPCLDERIIGLDDWEGLQQLLNGKILKWGANGKKRWIDRPELRTGFVLQCPFLAHKTLELAEIGRVYWCARDHFDIAASKAHWNFDELLWKIMHAFHGEFPDDPVWGTLKYEGREDVHAKFAGYAYLVCKVKRYFYQTRFKSVVFQRVVLEEQPYYDPESTAAKQFPLKPGMAKQIQRMEALNESICLREN